MSETFKHSKMWEEEGDTSEMTSIPQRMQSDDGYSQTKQYLGGTEDQERNDNVLRKNVKRCQIHANTLRRQTND